MQTPLRQCRDDKAWMSQRGEFQKAAPELRTAGDGALCRQPSRWPEARRLSAQGAALAPHVHSRAGGHEEDSVIHKMWRSAFVAMDRFNLFIDVGTRRRLVCVILEESVILVTLCERDF